MFAGQTGVGFWPFVHGFSMTARRFARMAMKAPPYMPSTYAADPPQRQQPGSGKELLENGGS